MTMILYNIILGSFEESFDINILEKHKVTHILNVASECEVYEIVGRVYAKYVIPDNCYLSNIKNILDDCIKFIYDSHKNKGVVFVHCLEKVGRSICIIIAYIVFKKWDYNEAYKYILSLIKNDVYPKYLEETYKYLTAN